MSLNGLDATDVQEAYQSAIAEAGGWFLLKYESRDAVNLLSKGKHGVSEARNALAAYPEASPLYGLLMYRRRRILIKYIPQGTSRLLQARTLVHLQDVLEHYAPHETLLELTDSDGLNDTALAASFHLHTASPSPGAGHLDELREEEEDDGDQGDSSSANTSAATSLGPQRYGADRGIGKRAQHSMTSLHSLHSLNSSTPPAAGPSTGTPAEVPGLNVPSAINPGPLPSTSPEPPASLSAEALRISATPGSESDTMAPQTQSAHAIDWTVTRSDRESISQSPEREATELPQRRQSLGAISLIRSQSMDDEPYDFSQYDALFKPKIKLGPRPITAPDKVKRPAAPRVSAVPGNVKTVPKKQEPTMPQSQGQPLMSRSATAPSPLESTAPALQMAPEMPMYTPRPMSRGSIRSAPSHKPGPMSADKLRLMKAVELRRKQMRKSHGATFNPINEELPDVPAVPDVRQPSAVIEAKSPVPQHQSQSKADSEQEPEVNSTDDESQNQSSKADSGIEIRYGTPDTQRTEETIEEVPEHAVVTLGSDEEESKAHSSETTTTLNDPSCNIDNGDHEDIHTDAASTTASQTPTEQPTVSEHGSEGTTRGPRIVLVDETPPRVSATEIVADSDQEDGDAAERVKDQQYHDSTDVQSSPMDVAKRRRGIVEPLALDTTPGTPDDDDLDSDDDELFEELHSATVQEAKPITVARSPIALAFHARRLSAETIASVNSVQMARAAKSPPSEASDHEVRSPWLGSSSASLLAANNQESASAGRARNVSSGISKRIQALTERSIKEASPPSTAASPGGLGKSSRRTPPGSRASYRRQSRHGAANTPTLTTPSEEDRPAWSVQHDPVTNRSTVSVSTRIARPGVPMPITTRTATIPEPSSGDELIKTPTTPAIEVDPPQSSAQSIKSIDSRSLRSHSRGRRFGFHRHHSTPALDEFPPPPPNIRITSTMSLPVPDENVAPKEGNKASRFFKRMSVLAGPKKKSEPHSPPASRSPLKSQSTLSPPQSARPMSVAGMKSDTPPAAVVGDLNVQFPDSLLWKRRIVTVDDYGVLQFAIAQAMDIHRGVAMKRYPLTEFKAPFVPDLDQQELPHSVVLEFDDGTSLQVACEDAMTQRQVLSMLTTYWKAYMDNMTEV